MVTLWPWKSTDSSPASFEKTLSNLSKKITTTQLQLDKARSNSRRIRVLWTLYLAFAYLVYAIVLILVVGWKNLGAWEWTGMAGGPVVIYLTRTLTNAYYTFRIDGLETKLKDQQTERAKTIQKLKDATKYDSTLELLEKYGGERPKPKKAGQPTDGPSDQDGGDANPAKKGPRKSLEPSGQAARTRMAPPPTANIQLPASGPGTPQNQNRQGPFPPPSSSSSPFPQDLTAEFAPNAGDIPPPSLTQYDYNAGPPRWYDRILDLMLGEDETAPKNRIVLLCQKCRLVNGQAPPGIRNLGELGQWRCMGCGAVNGEVDENKKIVQEALEQREKTITAKKTAQPDDEDDASETSQAGGEPMEVDSPENKSSTQPRRRSGRNKS
ncbi:hypothetical protein BX600DRAFT_442900 [Xylariales sp. PMI_506]|nr:hypothetical protein BX600DRAFT_442900 [Xylariales sp. PMI_506]